MELGHMHVKIYNTAEIFIGNVICVHAAVEG